MVLDLMIHDIGIALALVSSPYSRLKLLGESTLLYGRHCECSLFLKMDALLILTPVVLVRKKPVKLGSFRIVDIFHWIS